LGSNDKKVGIGCQGRGRQLPNGQAAACRQKIDARALYKGAGEREKYPMK